MAYHFRLTGDTTDYYAMTSVLAARRGNVRRARTALDMVKRYAPGHPLGREAERLIAVAERTRADR